MDLENALAATTGDYVTHTNNVSNWTSTVDRQLRAHAQTLTQTTQQVQQLRVETNTIKDTVDAVHRK